MELLFLDCKYQSVPGNLTTNIVSFHKYGSNIKLHYKQKQRFLKILTNDIYFVVDEIDKNVENNINITAKLMKSLDKPTDLLMMLFSIAGHTNCIIQTSNHKIVTPGFTSSSSIFFKSNSKQSILQKRQHQLLCSLFPDETILKDWCLLPKFSSLVDTSNVNRIYQYPRMYSDPWRYTFYDNNVSNLPVNKFNKGTLKSAVESFVTIPDNIDDKLLKLSVNKFGFKNLSHNFLEYIAKEIKNYSYNRRRLIILLLLIKYKSFVDYLYLLAFDFDLQRNINGDKSLPHIKYPSIYDLSKVQKLSLLLSPFLESSLRTLLEKSDLDKTIINQPIEIILTSLISN